MRRANCSSVSSHATTSGQLFQSPQCRSFPPLITSLIAAACAEALVQQTLAVQHWLVAADRQLAWACLSLLLCRYCRRNIQPSTHAMQPQTLTPFFFESQFLCTQRCTSSARGGNARARTACRPAWMVAAFWERGTRSMRMSAMSRRIARVVSSTSPANTNVQMGSAIAHRGSCCSHR